MEAILLAGLASEDRKGELKFRFSLHYSTLFDSPKERYCAFRVAKDLYDLRSTIAHGTTLKNDQCRVGQEKLSLTEPATRATEALRTIVRRFLPQTEVAPYRKPEFWTRSYFGLVDGND